MSEPYEQAEESGGGGGFFNHLPAILWQRRWLIIPPFVVLSVVGVAVAFLLPTTYRSSATLLVESQELPSAMVSSPLSTIVDQRIAKIRQQVLSRGDLIGLVEEHDLYPEERRSRPLSEVVEKMRKATAVNAVASDIGTAQPGSGTNTIAFAMSFDYRDPNKAQAVMQSFVGRFLEIDTTNMEDQATATVTFLQDQATKLQTEIKALEGQITSIKSANGIALAGGGPVFGADPSTYDAQIAALQTQNRVLQAQLGRGVKDPMVQQAEVALSALRSRYADNHPDVVRARQQLEELKAIQSTDGVAPDVALVQSQIVANNQMIASLSQARASNSARASAATAAQSRQPVVMEQVTQLENRANALRMQYNEVAENVLRAQNSARMAEERRGERLTVIDPPVVPDKPFWPNRPLLILGGIAGGLGLGLVLALLLELILRPVRGVDQVEGLGIETLAVVPTFKPDSGGSGFFSWFRFGRRARAVEAAA